MTNEMIAMILSLIGMSINIFSFQARKKALYLLMQSAGSIFFLTSYIFAGGGVAVWLNVIFLARNTIFMRMENFSVHKRKTICYLLCGAYILTFVLHTILVPTPLPDTLWGLVPIIGAHFGTFAILRDDPIKLRIVKLGDSFAWIAYNSHIGIGALGGILGEIFNIISSLIAMYRFKKQSRHS